jgi:PTH1 family peptidyl-tRNA hydrolase
MTMKIIIGLGNPGSKYTGTRHNIGFRIIERFAKQYYFPTLKKQYHGLVSTKSLECNSKSQKIVIVQPQTFMNLSGKTVQSILSFFKIPLEDIIVVHDELSLSFGTLRCKRSGGHAGHNGLRDISAKVGTNYQRLRFGINRPPQGWDTANYVLAKWSKEEASQLDSHIDLAVEMLYSWCFEGIDNTMNIYHQS